MDHPLCKECGTQPRQHGMVTCGWPCAEAFARRHGGMYAPMSFTRLCLTVDRVIEAVRAGANICGGLSDLGYASAAATAAAWERKANGGRYPYSLLVEAGVFGPAVRSSLSKNWE